MPSMQFRAGVVAVVLDPAGRILAFERTDTPGAWQLPQGGIDVGEAVIDAAWRELFEETGLGPDQVTLVEEYPEWTVYEWPSEIREAAQLEPGRGRVGKRLGQVQRWFFFQVRDDSVEPTPDGVEFDAWRWVDAPWLIEQVVEFRRPSYRRVLQNR